MEHWPRLQDYKHMMLRIVQHHIDLLAASKVARTSQDAGGSVSKKRKKP